MSGYSRVTIEFHVYKAEEMADLLVALSEKITAKTSVGEFWLKEMVIDNSECGEEEDES